MSDYFSHGFSMRMPKLEYFSCEQCNQMVFDNSQSVRWYHLDFCSITCGRIYFKCTFRVCATCQTPLNGSKFQIVQAAQEMFGFCDASCAGTYTFLNEPCSFCLTLCSRSGRNARTFGKKKYCSLHCIKAIGRIMGTKFNGGQCYTCSKKRSTTYQVKTDKENLWNICSDDCLTLFELNAKVKLATCSICHIKFDGSSDEMAEMTHFPHEKMIFCTKVCMCYYMKNDPRQSACNECSLSCRYYGMIRSLSTDTDERTWCSLECAERHLEPKKTPSVRDKNIESVNQELKEVNLSADRAKSPSKEIRIKRSADAAKIDGLNIESRTKYKIPIKTKEQIDISLEERRESFRLKCVECVRQIKVNGSHLRWQTMIFCSQDCLFDHMLEQHDHGLSCPKCDAPSRIDILGDATYRIGNETRYFCSANCKSEFVRDTQICGFCFNAMNTETDSDKRFCSDRCAAEYTKLYAVEKTSVKGECTDCEKHTTLTIQLLHDGKVYGFCSFRCFFFLKFSCGIYADQCEMCEKYFERNASQLFSVLHNDLSFIFCNEICVSHFMLKHRVMNVCSFCSQEKYNFDMIQEYDGHGKNRMLCSMKCLGYNAEPMLVENNNNDTPKESVVNTTPFQVDKMVDCRPNMDARATQSTLMETSNARTQTDFWSENGGIVPIPVPIYMPQPCLYAQPYPSPVPIVLPVLVPIVLPLNNINRIPMLTENPKEEVEGDAASVEQNSEITDTNGTTRREPNAIQLEFITQTSKNLSEPFQMAAPNSVQTSESSSVNQNAFGNSSETSTPIGSVVNAFLCDDDNVPAIIGPEIARSRRLLPDATVNEYNDELNLSYLNVTIHSRPKTTQQIDGKRSFSQVDSDDMQSVLDVSKKMKESDSVVTIS